MRFKKAYGRLCLWFLMIAILTGCTPLKDTQPSVKEQNEKFEETILFTSGTEGYTLYRIPGMVITGNGTMIAYCEARDGRADRDPMDILMRRSTDGGKTWGTRTKLAEGVPTKTVMNNPVMVAEKDSGTVHFFYTQNYEIPFYRKSTNNGETWSEPVNLMEVFNGYKPDYPVGAVAAGPGHGIQLSSGRIIVPFWMTTSVFSLAKSSVSTLYSDDNGTTWKRGEILRETPETISLGEPVILQRYDGSVLMNIRNSSPNNLRAVSKSTSGIGGWSAPAFDKSLTDPGCFGSIVRFTDKKEYHTNRILFSNINNPTSRSNLTIKMSMDEGDTWPYSRVITTGGAGYSDIAVSPDKSTVFCFYEKWEGKASYKYLALAKFNLEWLTRGEQSLDPLTGKAPKATKIPDIKIEKQWKDLSGWAVSGKGIIKINPAKQLNLADKTGAGAYISKKDISNIPQSYTLEFKSKIEDFYEGDVKGDVYPASLGTKINDGIYSLMLDLRKDGIYAVTNSGSWSKVKAVPLHDEWYVWKVVVNHGIAEVFLDDKSKVKFAMHSSSEPGTLQHWNYGNGTDAASTYIEYTKLYTNSLK